MSDIDTIRVALKWAQARTTGGGSDALVRGALALLDGAVGLAREGDVLLSGEQAYVMRLLIESGHIQQPLALLAAGRQEKP